MELSDDRGVAYRGYMCRRCCFPVAVRTAFEEAYRTLDSD
jgi:hypothetical protein